jgi:hypothetical protein
VAAVVYKFGAAVLFGVSPNHSVVADPLLALIRQHRGKAPSHWKAAGAEAGEAYMEGEPRASGGGGGCCWPAGAGGLLLQKASRRCQALLQGCCLMASRHWLALLLQLGHAPRQEP